MRKYISIIAAAIVMFAACKPSDFEDTNVSQYALSQASTRSLLTNSLQQLPATAFGFGSATFYVQHLSEGPYPGASWYSGTEFDFNPSYYNQLFNLKAIIDINSGKTVPGVKLSTDPSADGAPANQIAVARILKAYFFWTMTDRWGDIPYSDALKGIEVIAPKYDKQEDIYTDLFKEMTEAVAQIQVGQTGVGGDILFKGNMARWKTFANTARMMMALRLKKNKPAVGKTEFNNAITAGVIASSADDIRYNYLSGDPNNYNPFYTNYLTRNDYAISKTLTDYMAPKSDPRLKIYAETLPNGTIVGLPYGTSAAPSIPNAYSRVGDYFRGAGSPALIFSRAQVLFSMAEMTRPDVAWLPGGDAQAALYYADAIKASFETYGVYTATAYANYMAQPTVVYNAATGLQQIMTEKWVHLYLNGFESWTDWRRTGFPTLTPAAAAVQAGGIPLRHRYPSTENTVNKANYQAAVTALGGDTNYTKIWWLK
ncbi:MAG: SusD/RagB family nutrient-binding outer membrane lipoprotein [Pedobacter sp.]|nr:SusD/RagB family nutrient-binding outer membrane lipoprotein [Pedobacter sp.]MDQ8053166.1 SusD/RagB family nutrient-binding outer membrane lipoprotein [Pedobacter sp.]